MRALTSRSRRSPQAPSKTAASGTERKRRLVAFMAIPSVLVMACSHRGCLDIHLAGIDDLVLVAGRALDRLAPGLVDPAQLDLELLAERADLDRRLRIDHVDHHALRTLVRDRLLAAVDELYRAANVGGTSGQQQGGQGKECFYVHGLSPVDHQQVN